MAIAISGGSTSFTSTISASPSANRTVTVPDATFTVAGSDAAQTFSASQRGTVTTDNDGSFDMNVTNNFITKSNHSMNTCLTESFTSTKI